MLKRPIGTDRTLESFRVFPYIAWALIIGFAFFVYNITKELQAVTVQLELQATEIERQLTELKTSE